MANSFGLKGRLHYIEADIAGNLGLAWLVEFRDWARFSRWLAAWHSTPAGDT